jgi:CubicO group peptidase (beta-lactamase class C family)
VSRRRRLRFLASVSIAAIVLGACAGAADEKPFEPVAQVESSGASTTTNAPSGDEALVFEALATAVASAGANCFVVERGGRVVGEWYWQGFESTSLQEGFSTTKSLAATLVGIAQDQGALSIDQAASDFITEWKGTASETVTIRQLLSNTSGRFFDVVTDYAQLAFLEQDKSTFAVALGQQHDPGARWVYNNAAVQTLEVVLERAVGMPVATFAARYLFDPLGMRSRLSLDGAGNAGLFAGMQTNCLDLARLVRLYMDAGVVNERSVLSAAFIDEAIAPSSALNEAYGYLWWLNRRGVVQSSAEGSTRSGLSLLGAITEDVFYASGACGQVAMGFPSEDLVVTVMRPVDSSAITALAGCGAINMESVVADAVAPILEKLRQ